MSFPQVDPVCGALWKRRLTLAFHQVLTTSFTPLTTSEHAPLVLKSQHSNMQLTRLCQYATLFTTARTRRAIHSSAPNLATCTFSRTASCYPFQSLSSPSFNTARLRNRGRNSTSCSPKSRQLVITRSVTSETETGGLEAHFGRSEFVSGEGGVKLHCVVCEPTSTSGESPPLVVLLHGFPEFWYSWRNQIPALTASGRRVVAMDMRGYNKSQKPVDVDAYSMGSLVADVESVIRKYAPGEGRAELVVGHDWGGAVAWSFAMAHPDSFEKLAVLNLPHPQRFSEGLKTPRQLSKSWYIGAFQTPFLPEGIFAFADFALLRRVFKSDPEPPFSDAVIEEYVKAYRDQDGSMTASLNYYRAAFQDALRGLLGQSAVSSPFQLLGAGTQSTPLCRIEQPVLVIWGERDAYLSKEMCAPSTELVPNCVVVRVPDATHWVQHDSADLVNQELVRFLSAPDTEPAKVMELVMRVEKIRATYNGPPMHPACNAMPSTCPPLSFNYLVTDDATIKVLLTMGS
ncbi:hypothetical protein CYMTET_5299 [Cymbomonas tetramitiformis]|uniref:AB hydrolase-1 domain-containing protein n=1 Tax=Cymbomonas tetramitiformis TaxID=36881 RepID=A0AAE0GZF8_9CHLO|nr:hypothetical protein CYMTET_5299 [Cymbomonas tetramitiformis]